MPLLHDKLIVKKGFIKSIFKDINEEFDQTKGIFIISFDYLKDVKLNKEILTHRFISNFDNLIKIINNLKKNYGNFHLNYIIDTQIDFFFNFKNQYEKLKIYYFDILKKYNQLPGSIINKAFTKTEFLLLKNYFKKDTAYILFVNENIYRDFI